jgi:hypothetical protein
LASSQEYDRTAGLPPDFLRALAEHEEVLITSREGATRGTVPAWHLIGPSGVVYLFSFGFSVRARRWRSDPWVRLTVPDGGPSFEGVVSFVQAGPELDRIAEQVVERWAMQGATTVEGLKRTLRDGVHVLVRVEAA